MPIPRTGTLGRLDNSPVAEFDLYATCPRIFPRWLWRFGSGPLKVTWGSDWESVDWFERSTVVVPDDVETIRFTFVADSQPFARSPKVAVTKVTDSLVLYRASIVPLFFRPRIGRLRRHEPLPGWWASWPEADVT